MPDTSVKYFDSTMSGAPSLSGTAGALISVLDACLINGFGSVTLDSLVVAGNVATGTISTGHNFAMVGNTGPVITIAGATPSGLNGEWRVTVTSSTVFTFATTGITDQTATGTITAKRAPAGFSTVFSGTNKAVYRSDDVAGTRLYLRVDDSTTTYARVRGYETMSDVDTGTGPFPTDVQISGGGYVYKSNAASSATRAWTLFADGRMVYLIIDAINTTAYNAGLVFGDVDSYVTSDAYGCLIIFSTAGNASFNLHRMEVTDGSYIARAYTQLGTSLAQSRWSHSKTGGGLGAGGNAYPAVADNHVHIWPVEVWDGTTGAARGLLPGVWAPLHLTVPHGDCLENIATLPERTLVTQRLLSSTYAAAIDITGPWR